VSLGELAGGKRVRLQLVEEAADRLEAPPLPSLQGNGDGSLGTPGPL
jgi:hypothetical protein